MNNITLIGNLTADPEVRTTPNGTSVAKFTIAVSRRFKDADGNKQTDFIPITCWSKLAEHVSKYLSKGKKAAIVGSLQVRNYEDKNGNKRTAFEVVAAEVEFLTPKSATSSNDAYSGDSGYSNMDDSALPF